MAGLRASVQQPFSLEQQRVMVEVMQVIQQQHQPQQQQHRQRF
jgi:hypothetical protein